MGGRKKKGKKRDRRKRLEKRQARAEAKSAKLTPTVADEPEAEPTPAVQEQPAAKGVPAVEQLPEDSEGLRPAWLFRRMDHKGPWTVDAVGPNLNDIRERLKNFETMTWGEIRKTGSHPIPLANLCEGAQDRLADLRLNDYDELWSLRMQGKQRLWGIKDGRALLLLWWDPEHQVCPSNKKHT